MITAVVPRPLPPPLEGESSRLHAIVNHLRAVDPGFRLVVAEPDPPGARSRAGRLVASLLRLPFLAARCLRGPGRMILLPAPSLPFFETPSRIDLLLASAFLRLLALGCRARGSVLVLDLHDVRSLQLRDFGVEVTAAALEIFRTMERRSFQASDYVLSGGGDWPEYLSENYGIPRDRLVVFPNGSIRTDGAAPPPVELPGGFRFVYAGTMTPRGRGLESMVRAFTRVARPDAALILLGPGGEWSREVAGGDPRVAYLGALPVEQCISVLHRCQVALYPYPDLFYFAMTHTTAKIALYLTCGLPLLANRSRSIERFVRENDLGVVCGLDEMAEKMEEMAGWPDRLDRWRSAAKEAGRAFYWDVIIDRAFGEIARKEGLPPLPGAAASRPGGREVARAG